MALSPGQWALLLGATLIGSAVQGSLGFGFNVVLAPIAALVDPALVPAPLLLLGTVHICGLAWAERHHLRLGPSIWILVGRLPGVVLAVWLLTSVSASAIEILFGVMLLAVVGLSLYQGGITPSRPNLVGAGLVAGITGTTVSVGGPPIALVMASAQNLRADITAVMAIGTATSLGAVAVAGEVDGDAVRTALVLLPALGVGFGIARLLVGRLDRARTELAVYSVASVAALVLLVRGLT